MFLARVTRFVAETAAIFVAAAVLAAILIRMSPGFLVDQREFDPQRSEASIAAMQKERARQADVRGFIVGYLAGLTHGDFGWSQSRNRPIAELLADRAPITVALVLEASGIAVAVSIAAAAFTQGVRRRWPATFASGGIALLLTLPAGVVAMLAVLWRVGVLAALVAVLVPRLYVYCEEAIADRVKASYALTAEAFGISRWRLMMVHVLPSLAGEFGGVASLAVVMGAGASIPLEALCGTNGIGQLAWAAAMERDMPLVVAITLIMVLITRVGTVASRALLANSGVMAA